jgi:suppressor of fused protein SUFU
MNLSEYKKLYKIDEATPGWDAINSRLDALYKDQEPKHWGTLIKHMLGGPDPLDGISAYQSKAGGIDHLHFCSYGLTSLYYDEEAVGGDFSRFGFELTFRLASPLPPAEEPIWACNLMQNLARYVFDSGKWFEEYHWIPANGPIRADYETDLVV